MKTLRFIIVALIALCVSIACFADGRIIPAEQLPDAVKTFIKTHFPEASVLYAELDEGYEVRLNDGTEIDFTRKGALDNVDCKMKPVPTALVPPVVSSYVKANYPDALIVKYDKERYGCEIELSNGLEMKFNSKGQLISIDD